MALPDNPGPGTVRERFTAYSASNLYDFIARHGLGKDGGKRFHYSNLGFAVLGLALANRAGAGYAELLGREIAGPLGMKDTAISLSPEQRRRFLQGYSYDRRPEPAWDLDAFASAGGIRSTAGDLLTYLEAQLHPERTPLRRALVESQRLRAGVADRTGIALAWIYDPETGSYGHNGATGGFTSDA